MNKIKQWINPKEYLPTYGRLTLLKIYEHDYRFGRLFELNPDDGMAYFIYEEEGSGCISVKDIKAWCYIELDDLDF